MAKKRADTGAKRTKRSPLDDMRRDVRTVSFLKINAWFPSAPKEISLFMAELLRELAIIYGDEICAVDADRYRLPRAVMEGMEPYFARGNWPDFKLRVTEAEKSAILEHLGRQPRWFVGVMSPARFHDVAKQHFELEWSPTRSDPNWIELRLELSFGWALRSELERGRSLIHRLFERFAELGAGYACADPVFVQAPQLYSGLPPAPGPSSFGCHGQLLGGFGPADVVCRGYLPRASWRMLFGPMQLQRLGGRDALRTELAKRPAGPWGPSLQVRELGSSHLDLTLMGTPRDSSARVWFGKLGTTCIERDSTIQYFNARLAQAGLLMWHMPELLSLVSGTPAIEQKVPDPKHTERPFADSAAYMAHLWAHPPRSIRDVAAKPKAHERKWVEKHIGRHATAFIVGPEGGEMAHSIWTKSPKGTTARMKSPILVGGPTRSSAHFVFDAEKDGWDGQQNDRPPAPLQNMVPFACPDCGHDHFRAMAIFWYDDEDEWLDDPEMLAHVEDYFHWFTLRVTCGRCKLAMEAASIECA